MGSRSSDRKPDRSVAQNIPLSGKRRSLAWTGIASLLVTQHTQDGLAA
jgi:hypothetical protein